MKDWLYDFAVPTGLGSDRRQGSRGPVGRGTRSPGYGTTRLPVAGKLTPSTAERTDLLGLSDYLFDIHTPFESGLFVDVVATAVSFGAGFGMGMLGATVGSWVGKWVSEWAGPVWGVVAGFGTYLGITWVGWEINEWFLSTWSPEVSGRGMMMAGQAYDLGAMLGGAYYGALNAAYYFENMAGAAYDTAVGTPGGTIYEQGENYGYFLGGGDTDIPPGAGDIGTLGGGASGPVLSDPYYLDWKAEKDWMLRKYGSGSWKP